MTKQRSLTSQLAALDALRAAPVTEDTVAQVRDALTRANNHIVATAAQIAGEAELAELEPDLTRAFERLMRNPVKTDPGCAAKIALIEALTQLDGAAEDVYLRGIRYRQMEPTWGGQEDTAAALRGACALGLVRARYRHAPRELATLLADPEADARIAAARALAYVNEMAGAPLLRYKALIGDAHAQVLHECFLSLLKLDAASALDFVAEFLDHDDPAIAEAAALALGAARCDGAFDVLWAAWERTFDAELRRTLLLALATLRQERAIEALIGLVRDGARPHAEAALEALSMYRRDAGVWESVMQAVQDARDDGGA
jgi:HEAT repeat protein